MYHVTLFNLSPDALRADGNLDVGQPLQLSAEELRTLLDAFCEIDPLQNADVDPGCGEMAPLQGLAGRQCRRVVPGKRARRSSRCKQ